jgi:hypothetical protein
LFACGDDSTGSRADDGGISDYDSSLNPIECDGDEPSRGDGDESGDGDDDTDTDSGDDETLRDAGSSKPDSGTKPPVRDASVPNTRPDASTPTPSGTPVFVAVGYAGRHLRSTDLGVTWTDEEYLDPQKAGGDDQFLLRAVTFAKGKFVAAGWRILVSEDCSAGSWTEHTVKGQQWVGGLTFGNDRFVGTGGYGMAIHSSDGLNWTTEWNLDTNASRSLAFGNGKFMSATDQGNWWTSTDGIEWDIASGGHSGSQIAYCGDFKSPDQCSGNFSARNRAFGEGVTIRANGGRLERSTDGVKFSVVPNTGIGIEAVAFGYVE